MILADTDILVDVEREHLVALAWMQALPALPYNSGFSALEMLQGAQNLDERRQVRRFLSLFPQVWLSERVVVPYTAPSFTKTGSAHSLSEQ